MNLKENGIEMDDELMLDVAVGGEWMKQNFCFCSLGEEVEKKKTLTFFSKSIYKYLGYVPM